MTETNAMHAWEELHFAFTMMPNTSSHWYTSRFIRPQSNQWAKCHVIQVKNHWQLIFVSYLSFVVFNIQSQDMRVAKVNDSFLAEQCACSEDIMKINVNVIAEDCSSSVFLSILILRQFRIGPYNFLFNISIMSIERKTERNLD